jgi:hypothetical protein
MTLDVGLYQPWQRQAFDLNQPIPPSTTSTFWLPGAQIPAGSPSWGYSAANSQYVDLDFRWAVYT